MMAIERRAERASGGDLEGMPASGSDPSNARPTSCRRIWPDRLRAAEAALATTHIDVQDARIARSEAAVARLRERMVATR